jgi:hypothetical protein
MRRRLPEVTERLATVVAAAVAVLRLRDLLKPPGVAETLDWTRALMVLGARTLDVDVAARTLGAVLKYREDTDRVTAEGLEVLVGSVGA